MQVSDQEQVWTAVAHQLRDQLTEAVWYSTFGGVVPLEANGDHLSISVPSHHVRDRILTRYLPLVTDALDEVVAPGCSLDIVVAEAAHGEVMYPESAGSPSPDEVLRAADEVARARSLDGVRGLH